MAIELGKQIKNLRVAKGVTQEELGNYLGVSYQAVSKWENNVTTPDIQLLPILSTYFGITIDELFEIPVEMHMERIENRLENEKRIDGESFEYEEKFLNSIIKSEPQNDRAYGLLGGLYEHRAKSDSELAAEYARKAIAYNPYERGHHHLLIHAEHGIYGDAHYNRHDRLIEYYKAFIIEHPQYWNAYCYLMDQLIGDGRYVEASAILEEIKKVKQTSLDAIYEGDIAWGLGKKDEAIRLWHQTIEKFPDSWESYISHGDRMMKIEDYKEAITNYSQCMLLQEKPRLIDPLIFRARAYELLGQYIEAISTLKEVIGIIQEEHHILSGELIDAQTREIERLRKYL